MLVRAKSVLKKQLMFAQQTNTHFMVTLDCDVIRGRWSPREACLRSEPTRRARLGGTHALSRTYVREREETCFLRPVRT